MYVIMSNDVDFDHLPVTKPPKPTMRPLVSPEINVQLNVTPEKKGLRELFMRKEEQKQCPYYLKENQNAKNNALDMPTINSTTIVSRKLKELNESKFDATLLVKKELEKSERRRLDIAEKASEALNYNIRDSKYTGLVSLDVSASELELQQRKIFKERKTTKNQEEPDIMAFMSDDFQFESVNLSCNCLNSNAEPELFVPSTEYVFKLYEHMECWRR